MWRIERLELPFSKAKDNMIGCWKDFVENFKVPYVFLSERIRVLLESAFLTNTEILDVETSWEEIQKGQAKKFTNIDEFLKELKS